MKVFFFLFFDDDDLKGNVSLLKAGCDMNIQDQHVTTALKKDTFPII